MNFATSLHGLNFKVIGLQEDANRKLEGLFE